MKNQPVIIIKKKSHGHGGHHGGAWKVAYADFVTAMMAFFIVMWVLGQSTQVKSAIAGYFRNPGLFDYEKSSSMVPGGEKGILPDPKGGNGDVAKEAAFSDAEKLEQAAARIRQALGVLPELNAVKDQIEINMTAEGLRIELLESPQGGFFDSGSSKMNSAGEKVLVAIGRELSKVQNGVVFEGHTDSRPYQSGEGYSNWELSADRANTARRVMEKNGLHAGQVRGVRGCADTQLRTPDDPFNAKNRRVSIIVQHTAAAKP
ncbi:MAG TPA: flagellar motor protein MotB [Vicinamibacterales bacterium]|jgi:chemotaxis protein MotB